VQCSKKHDLTISIRRVRSLTQHSLPGCLLGLTWAGLAPVDRASFAWRLLSLDHRVGAQQEFATDIQSEDLRGFDIDDELELARLLDR
jgi:hypothetical protein